MLVGRVVGRVGLVGSVDLVLELSSVTGAELVGRVAVSDEINAVIGSTVTVSVYEMLLFIDVETDIGCTLVGAVKDDELLEVFDVEVTIVFLPVVMDLNVVDAEIGLALEVALLENEDDVFDEVAEDEVVSWAAIIHLQACLSTFTLLPTIGDHILGL